MAEVKVSESEIFDLKQEIILSQKINEEFLKSQMEEAVLRYTGKHVPIIGQSWDIVLNEIYPIIQFNLPSIYFKNPRAFLKPTNPTFISKKRNPITGDMEEIVLDSSLSAKTQEHILNYILREISYKREIQKVLLDSLLFKFGVLWHGYKGNFGMTEERSLFIRSEKLFVKRISPLRFLFDPAVGINNLDEARWMGRSFDIPLQDLMEDDTLTVDKNIRGKHGFGDRIETGRPQAMHGAPTSIIPQTKPLLEFADGKFKESMRSRFVEVFEIFVRPTPKEAREGGRGKVMLLTFEQEKPLRKPNPWPYKAEGFPGHVLEFNPVPDAKFGISDMDTYKSVADQKNAIVNLQLRNAQENSRVWVGVAKDVTSEDDLEMIRNGDQTIIMFNGDSVQGKLMVASPSGQASSELYLIDQRIQRNLEDKSGVTDLKRGFLQSGEESAASVRLRSAGGSVRPSYRQDIMSDFLKGSFLYINQLNKQFFTVTDVVRIVGSLDVEWSDTPRKEEIQADIDVEIDVISMLPENPEKEIQELQMILGFATNALSNPAILNQIALEGKKISISPIIENMLMRLKIRNPEIFRNIRPEESEGFVSVTEMRAARANVEAILAAQPELPSPPQQGQDHRARMEVYGSIAQLIQSLGETEALLRFQQLMLVHEQLLEEETNIKSPRVRFPLRRPESAVRSF